MTTSSHEHVAALLRRQQSTTARLRAGLPALLEQLESLEEPAFDHLADGGGAADLRSAPDSPDAEGDR